jgi:hypothetical protein
MYRDCPDREATHVNSGYRYAEIRLVCVHGSIGRELHRAWETHQLNRDSLTRLLIASPCHLCCRLLIKKSFVLNSRDLVQADQTIFWFSGLLCPLFNISIIICPSVFAAFLDSTSNLHKAAAPTCAPALSIATGPPYEIKASRTPATQFTRCQFRSRGGWNLSF